MAAVTQLRPAQQNLNDVVNVAMNQFIQELMQSAMQGFMEIVKANLQTQAPPADPVMAKLKEKKLLTKEEAAFYIGIHKKTLTDIMNAGGFYPLVRIGHNRGRVFFNREKLDQWINGQDGNRKTL